MFRPIEIKIKSTGVGILSTESAIGTIKAFVALFFGGK
jgi:hypothetical protein